LEKLEIHTYHSFATTYYSSDAKTDIGLESILEENMNSKIPLPNIEILVIDEIQDMNELYYRFVLKIMKDTNHYENIQILTLGDKGQGLYDFKGADIRYLTLSSEIFNFSLLPFKKLKLSTSYRITREISTFINDGMLGYNRLYAVKNGPNVIYMRHTNNYQIYKMIGFKLVELLKTGIVKPDDIFILSPSIKSESMNFIKLLENMLVSNGIPCYVPVSETSSVNSETIKNKVIFTSFHQSKGRERKLVVVFGFDDSYFKFFEREKDPEICPSTLYVAATRSTEILILVECNKPLPFLNYNHQNMQEESHIDFEGTPLNLNLEDIPRPTTPQKIHNTTPSDLIKFLDENVLISIMKIIKESGILKKHDYSYFGTNVKIQNSIKNQQYYSYQLTEEVSELNGLVIPAIFEERISKRKISKIRKSVIDKLDTLKQKQEYHIYYNLLKDIDLNQSEISIKDYLKITNVYNSIKEKLNFKVAQIVNYDWLNESHVDKILKNILIYISEKEAKKMEYEINIIESNDDENNNFDSIDEFTKSINLKYKIRFNAIVDAINDNYIWEFKCTDNLDPEHFLQLIIYAWLWKNINEPNQGKRVFRLLNIRNGEMYNLFYKENAINKIMELLLIAKFSKRVTYSDKEFINRCKNISDKTFTNL
jgi:hypothetical protein